MAVLKTNSFSTYTLTDEEFLQGSLLTLAQKAVIQNYRAELAEEKLLLGIDVDNPSRSIQGEAYLGGQIAACSYLLELSKAAKESLNT